LGDAHVGERCERVHRAALPVQARRVERRAEEGGRVGRGARCVVVSGLLACPEAVAVRRRDTRGDVGGVVRGGRRDAEELGHVGRCRPCAGDRPRERPVRDDGAPVNVGPGVVEQDEPHRARDRNHVTRH